MKRKTVFFLTKDQQQFDEMIALVLAKMPAHMRPECRMITLPVAKVMASDSKVVVFQDAWMREDFDDIVDVLEELGAMYPVLPAPIKIRMTE